jgi:hypothetical protein
MGRNKSSNYCQVYFFSIKNNNNILLILILFFRDLTKQFEPLKSLYSFGKGLKFGQMVMPFLPLNYGPLYLSKLVRVK